MRRLTGCGVGYRSFTAQYFDSCGIFCDAVIAIVATVAKQERIRISEPVRAGLTTARNKGKRVGCPRVAAMLNALVIAKVILAGEYVHLGKKYEGKPLFLSALYKAFLFSLLVFGFHHVEEVIKRLLHGQNAAGAVHDVRTTSCLGRGVIRFCTFISFFAFRDLRRVLGEDKFHDLFFAEK